MVEAIVERCVRDLAVSYPGHFPTAPALLAAGRYTIFVRSSGWILRQRPVVRCSKSFSIPDGEPGWFTRWEGVHVNGEDLVTIFVQHGRGARELKGLQCEIWSPGESLEDPPARARVPDNSPFNVIPQVAYPKDFEGARAFRHGVYRGEWSAWSTSFPVGAQGRRTLVRRFAFNWPDLETRDVEALWEKQR